MTAAKTKAHSTTEQVREWRQRKVEEAGTKLCDCGCGTMIPAVSASNPSKVRRFAIGHGRAGAEGSTKTDDRGYVWEVARGRWHRQHRLVWEGENGPVPAGMHVHHVNGDPADNRIENLELLTPQEHTRKHGRERRAEMEPQCVDLEHLKAEFGGRRSATPEQVLEIRQRVGAGEAVGDVADALGIPAYTVSRIWGGTGTWNCQTCEGKPPRRAGSGNAGRPPLGRGGVRREETINLRVTGAEKARVEENAEASGLGMSEYLRRVGMAGYPVDAPVRRPGARPKPAASQPEAPLGPDFERRVAEFARRMPRRAAESLVRREDARERAKGAVASG